MCDLMAAGTTTVLVLVTKDQRDKIYRETVFFYELEQIELEKGQIRLFGIFITS